MVAEVCRCRISGFHPELITFEAYGLGECASSSDALRLPDLLTTLLLGTRDKELKSKPGGLE